MLTQQDRERTIDWLIGQHASGGNSPSCLAVNALLIREYGDRARQVILAKRAETRARDAAWQQKWATNVSRRPQRGRHHDSWSIREKYVRYSETWPNPGA